MMTLRDRLLNEFTNCIEIKYRPSVRHYVIYTPLRFNNGEHPTILFIDDDGNQMLSDGGSTYMDLELLNNDLDDNWVSDNAAQKLVKNICENHRVEDREGEFVKDIAKDGFGKSLFDFSQALIKIHCELTLMRRYTCGGIDND